jgi:hypothetical protein
MSNPPPDQRTTGRCPLCRKPSSPAHAPFCSPACQDRDLLAWLDERYVVPGKPIEQEGEDG